MTDSAQESMTEMMGKWFAQLLVWPMRAVTPLMVVSCPFLLSRDPLAQSFPGFAGSWLHYMLAIYSTADVLFYVWFRKTLKSAQKHSSPPVIRLDVHKRVWKAIMRSAAPGETPSCFLRTWFPVEMQLVGRADVRNCLAVGFFGTPLHQLRAGCEELAEVDRMLAVVEQQQRFRFPRESPADMPRLHLLPVDPVPALHRPLFVYILTGLLDLGSDLFITACGFRRHRVGCVSCWVRRGDPSPPGPRGRPAPLEPPLVFVHGVGLGLVTYLPFLRGLFGISRYRAVVLLELPHVSMKLGVESFPSIQTIAACTEQALLELRLPPALWVCHSLGTFVFAGINRLKPHLIDSCVLLDPVCFVLWEATTMNNFCYCEPRTALEVVQQYHVCKELLISWYFQRHFYFSDAVLLREDLPRRAHVVVSQADNIYDTARVLAYLREGQVHTTVFPDTQHGGWLLSSRQMSHILRTVATMYDSAVH